MPKNEENKALNDRIRKLAPDAIETMGELLREPTTPAPTKAQLIGFILERTLGKTDTTIHLTTNGGTIEDSEKRLLAIAEEIRGEMAGEAESIPETAADPEEDDLEETDETEDDEESEEDDAGE